MILISAFSVKMEQIVNLKRGIASAMMVIGLIKILNVSTAMMQFLVALHARMEVCVKNVISSMVGS
jgi:hypothetical protein